MKRNGHSFIHGMKVATPCNVGWDTMTGDERLRFCNSCKLNVYNISSMTTKEAESLIIEKEGSLCVRFYRRKDGTVLTKDCPKGLSMVRDKFALCVAALAAFVALASCYLLSKAPQASGIQGNLQKVQALAEQAKQNALRSDFNNEPIGRHDGGATFEEANHRADNVQGFLSGSPKAGPIEPKPKYTY